MTKLEAFADSIARHEGFYLNGSIAQRYNNPGNIIFGELAKKHGAVSWWKHPKTGHKFAIFPKVENGWDALKELLSDAFSGKSSIYNPDMTVLDFFSKYSPVRNSRGQIVKNYTYAKDVAKRVGVNINTRIGDLLESQPTEELVDLQEQDVNKMKYPIDKVYITQKFGERPEVYKQFGMKGHNGIDSRTRFIDSPLGKRYVTAPVGGKIIEIGNEGRGGYGIFIRLEGKNDPNGNEQHVFGHLKKWYVKLGQVVSKGQVIGLTDNTGFSSGPHLHHGWRKKGWKKEYNNGYKGYSNPLPYYEV